MRLAPDSDDIGMRYLRGSRPADIGRSHLPIPVPPMRSEV